MKDYKKHSYIIVNIKLDIISKLKYYCIINKFRSSIKVYGMRIKTNVVYF